MVISIPETSDIKVVNATPSESRIRLVSSEAQELDVNQALSAENPASAGFFVSVNICGTLPVTKSQENKWTPHSYQRHAKKLKS